MHNRSRHGTTTASRQLVAWDKYIFNVLHQYSKERELRLSTDFMGQKCVGKPQEIACLACHLLWLVSVNQTMVFVMKISSLKKTKTKKTVKTNATVVIKTVLFPHCPIYYIYFNIIVSLFSYSS